MIGWKKLLLFCVVVSLIIPLTAMKALTAEKVLKVGAIGPFTGPAARTGDEKRMAAQMAFDNIGNKIGDYEVELVWIDTQSDPAKGTSAYSEAAERAGVQATIGNWHSSVAAALIDLAVGYKVPHIGGLGAAGIVVDKYKSDPKYKGYWMKGWPTPSKLTVGYTEALQNAIKRGLWKPAKKLVGLYAEDTDWGRDVAAAFKKQFTDMGWEIASVDYGSINQTDFYPLMSKYQKAGVSVIAATATATASMSGYIKQSAEVGLKAIVIFDGVGWVGEWYELTGQASDYVLDMIPQFSTAEAKDWAKTAKAKYGVDPSPAAGGVSYDCANLFIKVAQRALEKHGKLDNEAIHEVIANELCPGKLTYSAADGALFNQSYRYSLETYNDPVVGQDAWYIPVIQYMGGKGRIVFPEAWKEADIAFK